MTDQPTRQNAGSTVTKSEALKLLAAAGVPLLPSLTIPAFGRDALSTRIQADSTIHEPLVVRTSDGSGSMNLPRLVGASVAEASDWVLTLPDSIESIIVIPFRRVNFSIEAFVTPRGTEYAEVLPGIWETDAVAPPASIAFHFDDLVAILRFPRSGLPKRFVERSGETVWKHVEPSELDLRAMATWLLDQQVKLSRLRAEVAADFVLRVHDVEGYGLVAQNLRVHEAKLAGGGWRKTQSGDPVVALSASVERENAGVSLTQLFDKLRSDGIKAVKVSTGLLSHLAITARAMGFEVIPGNGEAGSLVLTLEELGMTSLKKEGR